jgi:hypothetical protein
MLSECADVRLESEMKPKLSLRPAGLGMANDFVVIFNGRDIARTYRIDHGPKGPHWAWSVYAFGPQDGSMRGSAATLDEAKRELRESIERCLGEGRQDHRDHPSYQGLAKARHTP